jgi:hypothetical protein
MLRRALPRGIRPRARIPEINRPITCQSAMRPGFAVAVLDHFGTKSAISAGFNPVHGRGPGGSPDLRGRRPRRRRDIRRRTANATNLRIALRTVSMLRAYLRTIETPLSISLVSLSSQMPIAGDSMATTSVKEIEKTPRQSGNNIVQPGLRSQSARWGERTLR